MDPLDGLIQHDYNPLKNLLRDILDQLKRATGRIDTLEKLVSQKDEIIRELQKQMSDVKQKENEHGESITLLRTDHTNLADHVNDIDSTLADLRFAHGLPDQINQLNSDLTSKINKLNDRVEKQTYQGQLDGLEKLESRMSIVEDRSHKNSKGIDTLQDSIDAISKRVTTNKFNIDGIQTSVKSMETVLPTKADRSDLSDKADKSTVNQLVDHLQQQQQRTSACEESIRKLRDLFDKLQSQVNGEEAKLGQLWDRTMCGQCRSTRPSVHCRQCDKNLCDACDHALHEDDDHRLHIRTPLYGHGIRDITDEKRVTTKLTTRPSSGKAEGPRVIEYVGGDTDALRKWCEAQFADVWGKDKALRAEISELFGKDRDLRTKLAELMKTDNLRDDQHASLLEQFRNLERDINAKINNSGFATHQYVDQQDSDLLKEIRLLEKAMGKAMKTELKRFERDIVVFLEDSRTEHNETSAGRIHFRCLTCDNSTSSQPGPATLGFTRAVGAPPQVNAGTTQMAIERGEDLWIHGRDGHIYKGRGDTTVTVTPGDPSRMSHFNVSYADKKNSRPASASAGSRPESRERNSRSPSRSSRVHHSLNNLIEEKTAELPDVTLRPSSAAASSRTRTFGKTQINSLMSPTPQQQQSQPAT